MVNFKASLADRQLMDVKFTGLLTTWHNKHGVDSYIQERLDRFFGDQEWCSLFPDALVNVKDFSQS